MKLSFRKHLLPVVALTAAVMIAGCPLPFEYNGKGTGTSHTTDPSSPSITAPVTVSYSVQGGPSGTVGDGSSFYAGQTMTVTLSTATMSALIFYTDDGNPLSLSSLGSVKKISASSGEITITRATTLQSLDIHAIAIGPNMLPSAVIHATVGVSPYPILSITRDNAFASEDGGTATFTITSSSAPASDITVNLATGGDYEPGDVTGLPGSGSLLSVTLPAGATTTTISITGQPDADGVNETVTLMLQTASTTPYTVGAPASASVVIQDNHTPVLTFTGNPSVISDNGGIASFTVISSFAPTSDVIVHFQTGGSYEPGDVTGIPGPGSPLAVVLPAGATTVSWQVAAHPDVGEYDNETATLSLVADSAYAIAPGASGSATVTILDTSPVGTLTLTADRAMMSDGQSATFTVSTSVPPEANLVVNISSSGYTAGKVVVPGSVTIPTGSLSATFVVTTPSEVGYPQQNPQVSLATGAGYIIGSPGAQSLLVTDDNYGFTGLWDFAGGLSSSVAGASPWVLTGNVPIVGGSLSLPGNYNVDVASNDVSTVINQELFTVGVSFRMTNFGSAPWGRIIIAGGASYRWLILRCDTTGNLSLDLNNHAVQLDLGSFVITPGTDHTLLLSIDRANLSVVARLDGVQITTSLPAGFTWNNPAGSDLILRSDDLSTGTPFAGLWHWIYVATGVLN